MKLVLSQSAVVLVASSSVTIAAWRLMQWRARKRAKIAAERVQGMIKPGPLINAEDKLVCESIVNAAIRRASKWISFQLSAEDGSVMVGQVGGVSLHKRPLLTLEPDYVMKPVQTDHRGIREIFIYEAVKVLSKSRSSNPYATLLTGNKKQPSQPPIQSTSIQTSNLQLSVHTSGLIELFDTLAMWLAMKMNDPLVAEYEKQINRSWKVIKKEVDILKRLSAFIPAYYGVVGQRSPLSMPKGEKMAHEQANDMKGDHEALTAFHYGMSLEAHLLLTDVTANYKKPCVMDLKMGSHTYEPDAPEDKRLREIEKYPQQEAFGFRIVGMRFYDPAHPDADRNGFRVFRKDYGRTLESLDEIADALRLFLSAGCVKADDADENEAEENGTSQQEAQDIATKPSTLSSSGDQSTTAQERIRIRVLSNLLAQLRPIMGFFDENKALCFYSSSLLLVYEGDRNAPNADVTSIKMIDFGRVRRETGGDHGYRLGLRNLKALLDRVRKEEKLRLS